MKCNNYHSRYIFVIDGEKRWAYSSSIQTKLELEKEGWRGKHDKSVEVKQVACHAILTKLNEVNETPGRECQFLGCSQPVCPYEGAGDA